MLLDLEEQKVDDCFKAGIPDTGHRSLISLRLIPLAGYNHLSYSKLYTLTKTPGNHSGIVHGTSYILECYELFVKLNTCIYTL